jgi:hypothetical protein
MHSEKKVAVITGASQGIGASLVQGFRDIGYDIIANSRSIGASDIADDPAILVIDGDISRPDTAERIVSGAIERFGRIDTLINNAGVFIPKPFIDYSEADFATMIAVNLAGFFHLSSKAAPWMLRARSGHIVAITAAIAEQPTASVSAALASMTKGGLNAAVCRPGHPGECRRARRDQNADACAAGAPIPRRPAAHGPHGRDARSPRRGAVSRARGVRHWRDPARRWRRVCWPLNSSVQEGR